MKKEAHKLAAGLLALVLALTVGGCGGSEKQEASMGGYSLTFRKR